MRRTASQKKAEMAAKAAAKKRTAMVAAMKTWAEELRGMPKLTAEQLAAVKRITDYHLAGLVFDHPAVDEEHFLIQRDLDALKGDGWIRCAETRPPDDTYVWTYGTCHRGLLVAAWDPKREFWMDYSGEQPCGCDVVTHWRPLPPGPENT